MDVIFLKGSLKMLNEHCLLQVISSESKYLNAKENSFLCAYKRYKEILHFRKNDLIDSSSLRYNRCRKFTTANARYLLEGV